MRRQRLREADHPVVLRFVAHLAPLRVIAILLAPARVAPGRLQVTARIGTDPDVRPRRRDDQRPDPRAAPSRADGASVSVRVGEAPPAAVTPDARPGVGRVAETGGLRRADGIERRRAPRWLQRRGHARSRLAGCVSMRAAFRSQRMHCPSCDSTRVFPSTAAAGCHCEASAHERLHGSTALSLPRSAAWREVAAASSFTDAPSPDMRDDRARICRTAAAARRRRRADQLDPADAGPAASSEAAGSADHRSQRACGFQSLSKATPSISRTTAS